MPGLSTLLDVETATVHSDDCCGAFGSKTTLYVWPRQLSRPTNCVHPPYPRGQTRARVAIRQAICTTRRIRDAHMPPSLRFRHHTTANDPKWYSWRRVEWCPGWDSQYCGVPQCRESGGSFPQCHASHANPRARIWAPKSPVVRCQVFFGALGDLRPFSRVFTLRISK
jgi:hypothetical protein